MSIVAWTKLIKNFIVCGILFVLQECYVECRGGRGGRGSRARVRGGGSVSAGAAGLWWVGLVAGLGVVIICIIIIFVLRWYYAKHGRYCCSSDA